MKITLLVMMLCSSLAFAERVYYGCDVVGDLYKNSEDCIVKAQEAYDKCKFIDSKCSKNTYPQGGEYWDCYINTTNCALVIPCTKANNEKKCCPVGYSKMISTTYGGYCLAK